MYENRHITEPKWKSWIIQTTTPLFTPDQCRQIIECGRRQPPQQAQVGMNRPGGGTDTKNRVTTISWIPFKKMPEMYKQLEKVIQYVDIHLKHVLCNLASVLVRLLFLQLLTFLKQNRIPRKQTRLEFLINLGLFYLVI